MTTHTISTRRGIFAAFASILLVATAAIPAAARPDPGPPRSDPTPQYPVNCPLERIGTQFVRCDNLTGAGVPAPSWVPEYRSETRFVAAEHLDHASEHWDR